MRERQKEKREQERKKNKSKQTDRLSTCYLIVSAELTHFIISCRQPSTKSTVANDRLRKKLFEN
jgi:hypothetical protein